MFISEKHCFICAYAISRSAGYFPTYRSGATWPDARHIQCTNIRLHPSRQCVGKLNCCTIMQLSSMSPGIGYPTLGVVNPFAFLDGFSIIYSANTTVFISIYRIILHSLRKLSISHQHDAFIRDHKFLVRSESGDLNNPENVHILSILLVIFTHRRNGFRVSMLSQWLLITNVFGAEGFLRPSLLRERAQSPSRLKP